MASTKRIQFWLILVVFLCLLGCMEAIRKAPRSALLFDSRLDYAKGKENSIEAGIGKSQAVLKEDMDEEKRILIDSGNDRMSNRLDYAPPGSNHDHDPPRGHHTHGNGNGDGDTD